MSRKKCIRCGNWMFEHAVSCPHCSADQNVLDPLMQGLDEGDRPPDPAPVARAPLAISREEAGSLARLASANAQSVAPSADRVGVIAWMIMPQSSGGRRIWEIGLTVLAMPLILITLASMGWWAFRFRIGVGQGEAWLAAPISAGLLFCLLMTTSLEAWTAAVIPGVMLIAWLVRGLLRRSKSPLL